MGSGVHGARGGVNGYRVGCGTCCRLARFIMASSSGSIGGTGS